MLCDNCEHKPVCGIFTATGGVKKCEHFKEERRGECPTCGSRFSDYEEIEELCRHCPCCGADMRGETT